jgi:anti-sigma regulatory factor (Ser/Thr protein kinase)
VTGPRPLVRATEVEASLDSLGPLGRWLLEAAREAELPEDAAVGLDHALHETVENVVRYAWPDPTGRRIRVAFRCDEVQAEVEVEDDGHPFDPRTVPPPAAPASLGSLVPGGYGIAMMRHFTDEIDYRRDGALNRLTLRWRLRGPQE